MKKFWLKTGGVIALVSVAIIAAKVFWPTENMPTAKSRDVEQKPEEANRNLIAQTKTPQPGVKHVVMLLKPRWPELATMKERNPQAEKLYQMAPFKRKTRNPRDMSHRIMADYCQQMLERYPRRSQVNKAIELLRSVQKRRDKQHNVTGREMNFPYPNSSQTKDAAELPSTLPQRYFEQYSVANRGISSNRRQSYGADKAIGLMLRVSEQHDNEYKVTDKGRGFEYPKGSPSNEVMELLHRVPKWHRR